MMIPDNISHNDRPDESLGGTGRRARSVSAGLLCLPLLLFGAPGTGFPAETSEVRVIQFSPRGTVKGVRQVSARFSEPMVPLGDPRDVADPFEIACPESGTARWVDSRTWVYDFARDLPAGVRCTFRVSTGLRSLDEKEVVGQLEFAFSTGGPAIRSSSPEDGNVGIDEEQAFVLVLDAGPTEASVLESVSFSIEGIAERVGVRLIEGKTRQEILKARYHDSIPDFVVVLQAKRRFPNGAKVRLVWGKGVATRTGVSTDDDQVLNFQVRGPFTATLHCEREHKDSACIPVTPIRVQFSAPVPREQARRIVIVGPQGRRWTPEVGEDKGSFVWSVAMKGPFPEEAELRVEVPADLKDDAGRSLTNADRFPLSVRTDPFPPLAKFSARFGIVESKADPALPVTLRNLEPEVRARLLRVQNGPAAEPSGQVKGRIARAPLESGQEILTWLRKVAEADRDSSLFGSSPGGPVKEFSLPKPHGGKAFEVIGVPLEAPGLYVVELESARLGASLLGAPRAMYVPTAALVTNLAVHFKWGRETSLVWVTSLNEGRPVPEASVAVHDCRGTVLWKGEADRDGIARIGKLPRRRALPRCPFSGEKPGLYRDYRQNTALLGLQEGLLVTARTPDDLSLIHSSWNQGIEPWRFQLPLESYRGPNVAHTIFDRPLFRAGDTVHMKHLIRTQALAGFSSVPQKARPTVVSLRHIGSNQKYDLPVKWNGAGVAESRWRIPREAKLGRYQVVLTRAAAKKGTVKPMRQDPLDDTDEETDHEWPSGQFRVEEFRVPLMRGVVRPPAEPLVAVSEFPVDLSVQYLAGGGASRQPVTLRTQVRPKSVSPPEEFENFTFANGVVKEGITRSGVTDEDELDGGDDGAIRPMPKAKEAVHQREELILDAAGTARTMITRLPRATTPLDVVTELEFRDPNGEVQTVSSVIPLWPADRLVGILPDSWVASKENLRAKIAVIDVRGRPIGGAPVQIDLLERKSYSHRKRLVGGFYAYEHVAETRRVGELCRGETDATGHFLCEGTSLVSGNVIIQASVVDGSGNTSQAHREVWVAGSEEWWFEAQDSDRIDLLPEKRRYEPGETARLQVRMPFREATALVAVEREGVAEASVVSLSGKQPMIEVPVREDYAPNMFISVLAVRGRVSGVQPTALIDLGRPSFKLGVAEIRVGWRAHELRVKVSSDQTVYRVREKAAVKIAVQRADGQPLPSGSEIALAAVDEGLLELSPNTSWNLLEAMMGRRGYGVLTATAQGQVIGKRHFGLKALPQGGGGGRQMTRELFDTLLLWEGRVTLDATGEASVEVPLNDSLTSFRIVAVATGGIGLFGSGSTTIRSTQDLMVLPGIAPLVREGDRFRSEVTLRNATTRPMDLVVRGRVEGLAGSLDPHALTLAGGEATSVGWEVTAPVAIRRLTYEIEAGERDGAMDRVRVRQEVIPAVPVRTFQATLSRWEEPMRQPVERPADAIPHRGGVHVALRPSLIDGLGGVRDWMSRYPYTCLEQKVSQAVALRDTKLWGQIIATLPSHLDSDGLLMYFPRMSRGSDVLTSYVLAIAHEAGWSLPADVRGRMEEGLRKFIEGKVLRWSELPTADLSIRKLAALESLSRYGKADPKLLGSIAIEPNLWPTSAVLDWWGLLHRLSGVRDREARLREAEQILRSRLNLQGTTMGFSTERGDALWWCMISADSNALRLILRLLESDQWKEELPRLMQGALGRQRRGAWDLTVANAWGALAVEKFSRAFERTPVTGSSIAQLADYAQRVEWDSTPNGKTLAFPWPAIREELTVDHAGSGHPWITVEFQAAIPLTAPLSSGYRITKTLTPIESREEGRFSRGDIVRVRLAIEAQSDMTWVVVNDPIPAGASHLGTGLGRESRIAMTGEERQGWVAPAFEERAFDGFRAYYEFVRKGSFVVEYTIRLNQSGRFNLPATRVEALYAPEMFGELPNSPLEVQP